MALLQSDVCFYNGTDASSTVFTSTLAIHIIFLVILLIWCAIWFFLCLFNIEDENHKNRGIYSTIAHDAPEHGINYKRWKDYFMMGWNFCQLFSYSFLDEFSIKSSEDSLFSISWLDNIIYYVKMILLQITDLGDLVLFFIMIIIILICICTILFCSCYDKVSHCSECELMCCHCLDSCNDYKDMCCKGYEQFFKALLFFISFGLCYNNKEDEDDDECIFYLFYSFRFKYKLKENESNYYGCSLPYYFFEKIPFIFKTIIYDLLYIPILSSLIKVFVCTYTCDYNPSIMNKEEAYPPLDAYTSISCNSSYTIICFILSLFAIAFYHVRASHYICVELDKGYSGDVSTNQKFQYIQMIGKFILTVLSTMFYFKPFIPLSLDLMVFIVLLIVVIIIPARTAFTMEHSRLYISLYTVQVLTALMALLSQIFSSSSSFFSLLTVCLIPFGFIFGWTFYIAPSLNDSYTYESLSKMLLNKDSYMRVLTSKTLIDFESLIKKDKEKEKEEEKDYYCCNFQCCRSLKTLINKIIDCFAFGSIFHRGLSLNELIINAGNVLMESIRRDYEIISFERYKEINIVNNDESLKENKRKRKEDYKMEVIKSILNLFDCEYKGDKNNVVEISGNSFVSLDIYELSSFLLMRDKYISGKSIYKVKVDKEYKIYYISELLEELFKSASKFFMLKRDSFKEKVENCVFGDYLLFPFYYPNSYSISLLFNFCLCLPFEYYFFFSGNVFISILNSFLFIDQSLLLEYHSLLALKFNFLFYLFFTRLIKECITIILPFLKIDNPSQLFATSEKNNDLFDYDLYNNNSKMIFISYKNCLDEKFCVYITQRTLSRLSSLFQYNWKCCAFFVFYINEKKFVDTFRNDEEYKNKIKNIKIKELLKKEKNDLWLLNKTKGESDDGQQSFDDFYLIYKYNSLYEEDNTNRSDEKEKIVGTFDNNNEKNDVSMSEDKNNIKELKKVNINDNYYFIQDKNVSESSEEMKKANQNEENILFLSHINNQNIPFIVRFLILLLYSKFVILRDNALLTLNIFLSSEKTDNEEEDSYLGPSIIYMICKHLSNCSISLALYYNIKCILKHQGIDNNKLISSLEHGRKLFDVIDKLSEYSFNSSIMLSSVERRRIIEYLCKKDAIEWIGSFYDYKEEKEKVIRLLYILISCSKKDVVSSLFELKELSVVWILLEDIEYDDKNMSYFSLCRIIDSFLFGRENIIIEKELLHFCLNIILILFYISKPQLIHTLWKMFLEKYLLFQFDFSDEKVKDFKKEIFEYSGKEWKLCSCFDVSSLPIILSRGIRMTREGNTIIYEENERFGSCIINEEMKTVYFLLLFEDLIYFIKIGDISYVYYC